MPMEGPKDLLDNTTTEGYQNVCATKGQLEDGDDFAEQSITKASCFGNSACATLDRLICNLKPDLVLFCDLDFS